MYSSVGSDVSKFSYWCTIVGISLLKFLLLNSYRSTDFEVHRNWLAITHTLPLEKWYYEETSQWTLDYPPFFAYFEWALSHVAVYFDKDMLKINNLNYASFNTILFQKASVIAADFVLAYAVWKCSQTSKILFSTSRKLDTRISLQTVFVLIFLNAGLFLVDHVHFQYNGFLFGILLLSISKCLEGKLYQSAFIFAALINFKHIFLYIAPAYGIFLLRRKCFPPNTPFRPLTLIRSLVNFAAIAILILGASFGPFYQHVPQILKRLFPFQRGLAHAYWAPNIWAAYNTMDWTLNIVLRKGNSSVTSGLVGEATLSTLPQVLPLHTLILTIIFMLPALYKIWKNPTELNFLQGVIATGWTSFMFGYHVHEKAILNVLIPFALTSFHQPNIFFITSVTGTVSLFPLLFTPFEIVLKAILAILHFSLTYQLIPLSRFKLFEKLYLSGFVLVYLYENIGPVLFPRYPFLPLMCVSNYCFLGIFYSYVSFYWNFVNTVSISTRYQTSTPKKLLTTSPITRTPLSLDQKLSSPKNSPASPKTPNRSSHSESDYSSSTQVRTGNTSTSRSRKRTTKRDVSPSTRVLRSRNK